MVFGADWPVCQVAGGYVATVDLAREYSPAEQARFWGSNAAAFYHIAY